MQAKAMDVEQVCAWVAGFLDLDEKRQGWTPAQSAKVAYELDQALVNPGRASGAANDFGQWLQAFMEVRMDADGGAVPEKALDRIRAKLDSWRGVAVAPAPAPAAVFSSEQDPSRPVMRC